VVGTGNQPPITIPDVEGEKSHSVDGFQPTAGHRLPATELDEPAGGGISG